MSAGGAQSTSFNGTWNLFCNCRCMSAGCKFCPARADWARKGYDPEVVVPNSVSVWEKIHDRCKIKPDGLILVCSDSDMYIEEARAYWPEIVRLFGTRPDVTFTTLTKRLPENAEFVAQFGALPNLWLGTSAEDQRTLDERVAQLYAIPAESYVLSLQPLLSPLNLSACLSNPKLKYVITGCELGDHARRCPTAWLEDIVAQCEQHNVESFVTRWVDQEGKVQTSETRDGRGGNRRDRPGWRPDRQHGQSVLKWIRERQCR